MIYSSLAQVWYHTTISATRKLELLQSILFSLVLYGLITSWLNAWQRRQLDGFQARCLRDVLRIPHAYVSRISDATVLSRSGQKRLTTQLCRQQLLLMGKVARTPNDDIRNFSPGTLQPITHSIKRRVGLPHAEWAPKLLDLAQLTWRSAESVEQLIRNEIRWETEKRKSL